MTFSSTELYSKSATQLQEHPDGLRGALSLVSFWKLNAPGIIESTDKHPSLNEGDYSGDLRDFRDSNERDSIQR